MAGKERWSPRRVRAESNWRDFWERPGQSHFLEASKKRGGFHCSEGVGTSFPEDREGETSCVSLRITVITVMMYMKIIFLIY